MTEVDPIHLPNCSEQEGQEFFGLSYEQVKLLERVLYSFMGTAVGQDDREIEEILDLHAYFESIVEKGY